ncbi:PRD domain-containing protein [Streptococcus suis]|uniref:PRD domain-containing protein n=1 Tax=Streptococcus suis TaxID=1307 RepID=UPI0038BD63A2
MFRIVQALNNNVALVKNENEEQAVVMGLGITFQKKKGDVIAQNKIEKIFQLKSNESKENLLTLLKDVPLDFITVTYDIINSLTNIYQYPVQEYLYVTLTDHIYFSYQSLLKGTYQNSKLPDISSEYSLEYQMAREALEILRQRILEDFPEGEVFRIALHFINAKGENQVLTASQENLSKNLNCLIEQELQKHGIRRTKENSNFYDRFMIHQTYFIERIERSQLDSNPPLENLETYIKDQHPEAYRIGSDIYDLIAKVTGTDLSKTEKVYIVLHIQRLL